MFRTAATKIAHNSTLPALAGNKDLKPLQELITSEKSVLQSLQKLSNDLAKASECLRHWGMGEGDDLQDVLSASTNLLGHLSSALLQLANHEVSIREQMKAVRSREENLDELRRRRKAVSTKADSAEKRLSKMSPEHKSLQQQTELLNNLRDQIRNLDYEILSEEAKLGDFKRSSTKNWMMLKFGGLLECAEKATIVAEMGKLAIEEIPLDVTQPGQPRSFYTGHDKTEKLVIEAQRCISEIVFDPQLSAPLALGKTSGPEGTRDSIDGLPGRGNVDSSSYLQDTGMATGAGSGFATSPNVDEFGGFGSHRDSRNYGTMPSPMHSGPMRIGDDGSRISSTISESTPSNFGSSFTSTTSPPSSRFAGGGSGQFSTFPVRKSSLPPGSFGPPPMQANQNLNLQPLGEGSGLSSDFAAEVADALAYAERDGRPVQGKISLDGPAPSYQTHDTHGRNVPVAPSGLPRGAAPPTVEPNPWDNVPPAPPAPLPTGHLGTPGASPPQPRPSHHVRENETTDDEETQLPYASPPPDEHQLPSTTGEEHTRHVHFGGDALGQEIQERIPSPPPLNDADANAAAAREVAREMDSLTFNPPGDNRAPSPLRPPVPPFAQQRTSPSPEYGATMSPRSEGMFSSSKTDIRGPPLSNTEVPNPHMTASSPPSPAATHHTRPSMSVNVHSPSPAYSFNSTNTSTYGTPPEMPASQPLRTGSPASPSMLAPGTRTISAAAFKRPGIRSPTGGSDSRPLPDVSPLSLRKKSGGLPPSPYAGSREALPNPSQGPEGQKMEQEPHPRPSDESLHGPPDYESTYEFVSSYGEPTGNAPYEAHANGENAGASGYGSGKFATNLDNEGLR